MKKVLLIGNIWPYHQNAGNCIYAIARFLAEYGWEPIILTTPLPDKIDLKYRVEEVSYYDPIKTWARRLGFKPDTSIKKQLSHKLNITARKSPLDYFFLRLREVLVYPDAYKNWQAPAFKVACKLIEKEDIRAIITDSPPVSGLVVASNLRKKYQIPWLVYFSHLWSQNNGYQFSSIRRYFDIKLELKTLSNVDLMITHSDSVAEKQMKLLSGKTVLSVFEGFDPDTVNDPPAKLSDKFTITYTGSFSVGLREPTSLFVALQKMISQNKIDPNRVVVRFYGPEEIWIEDEIKKYGLSRIAIQYGRISMEEAQAKQRESQILYNPKWDDPQEPGIYSGKFFEYLAARRPILAIGKFRDVVDTMIEDTGAGVCASSVEEVERALEKMYREYIEEGEVKYRGDPQKLERSSHRDTARRFSEELDHLFCSEKKC